MMMIPPPYGLLMRGRRGVNSHKGLTRFPSTRETRQVVSFSASEPFGGLAEVLFSLRGSFRLGFGTFRIEVL